MATRKAVPVKRKPRTELTAAKREELENLLLEYKQFTSGAKELADLAAERKAEVQKIIETLDEDHQSVEAHNAKVTMVRPTSKDVNLDRLKEFVTRAVFGQITDTVLDTKAFEQAVLSGKISPEAAADVTTVTPKKSYVKITVK